MILTFRIKGFRVHYQYALCYVAKSTKDEKKTKLRRIHVLGFSICVVVFAIVVARILTSVSETSNTPYQRWKSQAINRYEIDVLAFAAPAPPVALRLTVNEGEIVDEIIIACEDPSDEDPANLCVPVRTWYTYLARYTIDDLFEISSQCRENTRLAFDGCSYIAENFQGFESQEELFQAVEACEAHLRETAGDLCTVHYNESFGYPEEIFAYMPFVDDGISAITVRDFRIDK